MKKILLIISIVSVISAIMCGVTAFATNNDEMYANKQMAETQNTLLKKYISDSNCSWIVDQNRDNKKEYVNTFNESIGDLIYSHTQSQPDGTKLSVYQDLKGNCYDFTTDDECVGYYLCGSDLTEVLGQCEKDVELGKSGICGEDAIKIADDYAKKFLGEKYDYLKLAEVKLEPNKLYYIITYSHLMGEEKRINGAVATAYVSINGDVVSFKLFNYYETVNFDESSLDGITVSKLENKILEMVGNSYEKEIEKAEIDHLSLCCENGAYYIKISALLYPKNSSLYYVDKFTYDIP